MKKVLCLLFILLACSQDTTLDRGKTLLQQGNTTAAIQQFQAALQQKPTNAEAAYQLGLAYEELGNTPEALDAFRTAVQLAPKHTESRLALTRIYWHAGNRMLAATLLQKLLNSAPNMHTRLQIAALTGDAYHVYPVPTHGSGDYEQTFTEKGTLMTYTARHTDDYSPAFSPDGQKIAFASNRLQNADIYLIDLSTHAVHQLTHTQEFDEYMPTFSPDGQKIAFVSEPTRGGQMLPPVQASGSDPTPATLYLMDSNGQNQRTLYTTQPARQKEVGGPHQTGTAQQRAPTFSPDGQKIAFEAKAGGENETLEIFVIQTDGTHLKQLTHNDVDDGHPTWAPNGKQIAFTRFVDDRYQIWTISADGKNETQLTFAKTHSHYHPSFSPDGKHILYVSNAHNQYTLWRLDADGTHKTQLTNHIGAHFKPSFSKDRKRIVFSSDRSDHMRLYLIDLTHPIQVDTLKARLADL